MIKKIKEIFRIFIAGHSRWEVLLNFLKKKFGNLILKRKELNLEDSYKVRNLSNLKPNVIINCR